MSPWCLALPATLLLLSPPLGAEPPVAQDKPVVPQPVLLDWGGQYRLNAMPNNAAARAIKQGEAAEQARVRQREQAAAPSHPGVTLGPEDPAKTRFTSRNPDSAEGTLQAPLAKGPVSLGASYGKYRAVPNIPSREVSADDMRVTMGVHF